MTYYTKTLIGSLTDDGKTTNSYDVVVYDDANHTNVIGRTELHVLDTDDIDEVMSDFMSPYQEPVLTYGQKRQQEYPPIKQQLDKIFHDGIDAWKAEIQAIKDKYPKE